MIHYLKDQILKNNKVQTEVPKELVKQMFDYGLDLWFFIEEWDEYDDSEDDADMDNEDFCPFPMSCVGHSQEDEWDDVNEGKTYYVANEWLDTFFEDEFEICGGDGVEYELYVNKSTLEYYRVPIQIVRDFSNATKS